MTEATQQQHRRRATDVVESAKSRRSVRVRTVNIVSVIAAVCLAIAAIVALRFVMTASQTSEEANELFYACESAADDMQIASDFLTAQARLFIETGNTRYLDAYLTEFLETDTRGKAVETLRGQLEDGSAAEASLSQALALSNELADVEFYAMRLTAEAKGLADMPEQLAAVEVSPSDAALSAEDKQDRAVSMVLSDEYQEYKDAIAEQVTACTDTLSNSLEEQDQRSSQMLHRTIAALQIIVILFLLVVIIVIFTAIYLVLMPLGAYAVHIKAGHPLKPRGAHELRYLADAYNTMYEENRLRTANLQHAAEHDALTGLFNRGAYDAFLAENSANAALILLDIDHFKEINDIYGHDMGDAILKKVASCISHSFRLTDYPCRIGGDEFAVIMTDMHPGLESVAAAKVEHITTLLRDSSDGLPSVNLSVGIAFSGAHTGEEDLYRAADKALYVVKEHGRNGYAFYGEDHPHKGAGGRERVAP